MHWTKNTMNRTSKVFHLMPTPGFRSCTPVDWSTRPGGTTVCMFSLHRNIIRQRERVASDLSDLFFTATMKLHDLWRHWRLYIYHFGAAKIPLIVVEGFLFQKNRFAKFAKAWSSCGRFSTKSQWGVSCSKSPNSFVSTGDCLAKPSTRFSDSFLRANET